LKTEEDVLIKSSSRGLPSPIMQQYGSNIDGKHKQCNSIESLGSIRTKFRSLDFSRSAPQSNTISKVYRQRNSELKNTSVISAKKNPKQRTSHLKAPTEVKDHKILDQKAIKITIGNQPNQRKGR
jgi:hypothetical protein